MPVSVSNTKLMLLGCCAISALAARGWEHQAADGATRYSTLGLFENTTFKNTIADVTKHPGPLFTQDKPWEPRIDNGYPNVVHDPSSSDPAKVWQLWYGTCGGKTSCSHQFLLYANSADGLAWNKPELNRYDVGKYFPNLKSVGKNNNIVMYGGGLGIYRDMHEKDPNKRYKISGGSPGGCYSADGSENCIVGTAASPDGINGWIDVKSLGFPKPWRPDCHTNVVFDQRKSVYLMTTRDYINPSGRDIAIAQSKNGTKHWTGNWSKLYDNEYPAASEAGPMVSVDPKNAAAACGLKCRATTDCAFFWVYTAGKDAGKCFPKSAITGPVRKPACTTCGGVFFKMDGEPSTTGGMTFDSWDTPVVAMQGDAADQLYSQITFPFYDVFLGIVMVFDAESKAGHVHCRLSWSPDGLSSWLWVDAGGLKGAEFIPAGRPGEFDSNVCFAAHLPVRMEDGSSRLYFMGGNGPHSGARNSSFGLATARPDRFAGVSGSGYSVTKPLTVTGATILLTADILAPGGSVTVGVVGQGAGLAQATPLAQNATDHAVRFPSAPSGLQPLVGKQVRLSITAKDAAVYTVGFR